MWDDTGALIGYGDYRGSLLSVIVEIDVDTTPRAIRSPINPQA